MDDVRWSNEVEYGKVGIVWYGRYGLVTIIERWMLQSIALQSRQADRNTTVFDST